MIRVHFLINKLNIEHIIALGGKKSNEKLGKKGNRCKNAANSVTGHVCVNSNESIEKCMGGGNGKILPPPYCSICTSNPSPRSIILHILAGEGLLAGKSRRLCVFFIFNDPQI